MPSLISLQSKAFMFLEWINPLPWLTGSGDQRPKATLAISQGEDDRWHWELIDEDGFVHGRSTADFLNRTQALASARYAQFMILDSLVTDERGREIQLGTAQWGIAGAACEAAYDSLTTSAAPKQGAFLSFRLRMTLSDWQRDVKTFYLCVRKG